VASVRTIQIGVNQADPKSVGVKRKREVNGCSSFTYAAFAATDGDDWNVIISWHGYRS
jgi:hypothetical protein